MTIIEQLVKYLRGAGFAAYAQYLPDDPDLASGVFASDMRIATDTDGARVQIITRSERDDTLSGLQESQRIAELLDGFSGIFTIDGNWINNIQLESGPASIGADTNNRLQYSTNYRVWYCV